MPAARGLPVLALVTIAGGLTLYAMWALLGWLWGTVGSWVFLVLPLVFAAPPLALFWVLDRRRRRRQAPPTGS